MHEVDLVELGSDTLSQNPSVHSYLKTKDFVYPSTYMYRPRLFSLSIYVYREDIFSLYRYIEIYIYIYMYLSGRGPRRQKRTRPAIRAARTKVVPGAISGLFWEDFGSFSVFFSRF